MRDDSRAAAGVGLRIYADEMGSSARAGGRDVDIDGLKKMGSEVHDLCQPLTTLQCRLELAKLVDTEAAYREAVEIALTECVRMNESVDSIREQVRRMMASGDVDVE